MSYDVTQFTLTGARATEIHAEGCADYDEDAWRRSGEMGFRFTHRNISTRMEATALVVSQRLFPHSAFDDPSEYLTDMAFGPCLKDMPVGTLRDGHAWKEHNASLAADAVRHLRGVAGMARKTAEAAHRRLDSPHVRKVPAPGQPDEPVPPDLVAEQIYTSRLWLHWSHVVTESARYEDDESPQSRSDRRFLRIATNYASRIMLNNVSTRNEQTLYTSPGGYTERRSPLFALAYRELLVDADTDFYQEVQTGAKLWVRHNGGNIDG